MALGRVPILVRGVAENMMDGREVKVREGVVVRVYDEEVGVQVEAGTKVVAEEEREVVEEKEVLEEGMIESALVEIIEVAGKLEIGVRVQEVVVVFRVGGGGEERSSSESKAL